MTILRALAAIAVIWTLASVSVFAQHTGFSDSLLNHLSGRWLLQGTMVGQKTVYNVDAKWVLEHNYLRLNDVSRVKLANGKPNYEADVYIGWNKSPARYACILLDTFGGMSAASIGYAKRNGDSLPFVYKDGSSTYFTTFAYIPASDSWTMRMDFENKGKSMPLARLTLTRRAG